MAIIIVIRYSLESNFGIVFFEEYGGFKILVYKNCF